MSKIKIAYSLWALALLVFLAGCDHVLEIHLVDEGATIALLTVTPTAAASATAAAATAAPSSTATASPTATGVTTTPTATTVPPTATPTTVSPTATSTQPAPTATATSQPLMPVHIHFAPGTTSATLTGQIGQGETVPYVLRALAGQTMDVVVTSPSRDVLLAIVGADGVPVKRYADGLAYWRDTLPSTQDYYIDLISVGAPTRYELTVWISALRVPEPIRVRFAPGTTSATFTGTIRRTTSGGVEFDPGYILRAFAGQTMDVRITSPNDDVLLTIVGADGIPLKHSAVGGPEWRGVLYTTQDYLIIPVAADGETSYTLTVWVSPLELPEPTRIRFAPGATSATVVDELAPGTYHRYVLRALAGQEMRVHVWPASRVDLAVAAGDGSFWNKSYVEEGLTIEALPATQDYVLTLAPIPPDKGVSYTMEVGIYSP